MNKIKKYSLIIVLVVLIIIAITLMIVKLVNNKKVVQVSEDGTIATNENNEEIAENTDLNNEGVEETNTGEMTQQQPKTPTTNKEETPKDKKGIYYIKINYGQNVVTVYEKDESGNYTKPIKAMVCSTGTATPTSGTYTIPNGKWDRWTWGQMQGGVWAQYYVRIKGSILFHSVPYTSKDKSTLEYWEYDKLGTKASAGCIRLTVQDAKWVYDNCSAGSQVEFYTDSNPGPLGKPTAQKISTHESVRGWDPTDPDTKNPWKTYKPIVNSNVQVPTTENTSSNSGQSTVTNSQETIEQEVTSQETEPIQKQEEIKPDENKKTEASEVKQPDESKEQEQKEEVKQPSDSGEQKEKVEREVNDAGTTTET